MNNEIKIKLLNKISENVNFRLSNGKTLLIEAIFDDDLEMINFLLNNGADINYADDLGNTPLIWIAIKGYDKYLTLILKSSDINKQNNNGVTALMWATINGHVELINTLINHGANLNIKSKWNMTAYDYAIYEIERGKNRESVWGERSENVELLLNKLKGEK